jgi:hypothetical protein
LAQIAFQQFLRTEPYPGQIVTNFKNFLFEKFSVPSDMHSDPKQWSTFLMDSLLEVSPPPKQVHAPKAA